MLKRMISLLLCMVMVISMVPVQVFATDDVTEPTEIVTEPTEETTAPMEPTEPVTEPTEVAPEATIESISKESAMSTASTGAAVASGTCGENLTWTLENGTLTISGTGNMHNYESFGAPWYDYQELIDTVKIDNGVTSIGNFAFSGCDSLTSVTISDSVISIGSAAFMYCDNLSSVTIPDSVTDIGDGAFIAGHNFSEIQVEKNNKYYSSDSNGVLFDKSMNTLIQAPMALSGSYSIPDSVTSISNNAFAYCENLTGVSIPNKVTSIGYGTFFCCLNLTSVEIGDGVTSIGEDAFNNCYSLANVTIPSSVNSIDNFAFEGCSSLTSIIFEGNAPEIAPVAFVEIEANAFYPADNKTWTDEVMQDYGGAITWEAYTPSEIPGDGESDDEGITEKPCRLDELTELDYLAFSSIAYLPFEHKGTVKEQLTEKGYWDKLWSKEQNITYAELCAHIAPWEVGIIHELSSFNGFYALTFTNDSDETVIAYRGSVPFGEYFGNITDAFITWDFYCDWFLNDLPLELGNNMGPQLDWALDIYNQIAEGGNKSDIVVTGHSLGGAWADVISAYSGCRGVSFNAVSILDVLYKNYPELMANEFTGVDNWNFVDHTNQYDLLAGMYEKYISLTRMKPFVAHKSNISIDSTVIASVVGAAAGFVIGGPVGTVVGAAAGSAGGYVANCHGLQSIVVKDPNGNVHLTGIDHTFTPSKTINNYMTTANHSVDWGTSGRNIIEKGNKILVPRTSFGGDSDDAIYTSWQDDCIVGGRGDADILDGSFGNDTYIYRYGDGYDVISDISGYDVLKICGFSDIGNIYIQLSADGEFVDIYHNDECIISVRSKNRAKGENAFLIEYDNGVTESITGYLNLVKYSSSIRVGCPVDVEILDIDGNVIFTLNDGEVGVHYTDYGNFYIYEEENGSYGKSLDLIEGYTARIVGQDDGTMDIEYRDIVNGEISETSVVFTDIPVTNQFIGTFEESDEGELILNADTDGDNVIDTTISHDSISISQENLTLGIGESAQLTATVQPENLAEFVRWSTDDESIITVDEKGLVTAVGAGSANVIASVSNGNATLTAQCKIEVSDIIDQGTCGDNATWVLTSDGTLTISGTGPMNQCGNIKRPWMDYELDVKKVIIEEGITTIGVYAFYQFHNLEEIVIPSTVGSIFEMAFNWCKNLKSITLPKNLTWIHWAAISYCQSIESITIPRNVAYIDKYALDGCSNLKEIYFEGDAPKFEAGYNIFDKVTATAYYPEDNATWTEAVMQDYGGTITWEPYKLCANGHSYISAVTAPNCTEQGYTTHICSVCGDSYVDSYADALGHSYVEGTCAVCGELDPDAPAVVIASGTCGKNATWTLTNHGTLTISGTGAMGECGNIKRPWMAYDDEIKHIIIEDGITSIAQYAFVYFNYLESIEIPDTVKSIGEMAFNGCVKLQSITLPKGLSWVDAAGLAACKSLEKVVFPESLTYLGTSALLNSTEIKEVYFEGNCPNIQTDAFGNIEATVYYPANDTTWTAEVMQNYGGTLTWVALEAEEPDDSYSGTCGDDIQWTLDKDGNLRIEGTGEMDFYTAVYDETSQEDPNPDAVNEGPNTDVLYYTTPWLNIDGIKVKSVYISDGVTSIGSHAFSTCDQLTKVRIPDTVNYIGMAAFSYCTSLEEIDIPESVTIIDNSVFFECHNLKSIRIPQNVSNMANYIFYNCQSLSEITFCGDAPNFFMDTPQLFCGVTATAYYPGGNSTWTSDKLQDYGGTLTWVPYGAVENRIVVNSEDLNDQTSVWIDGREYAVQTDGDNCYIDLPDGNAKTMIAYTCHAGDPSDIHTRYPIGMKVWILSNTDGVYTATRTEELDNILQYSGTSIRVTGKQGIRMITSIEQTRKNALTSDGLAGCTLKEYGTVVAWASQLGDKPLVLGESCAKSNYAYKKGMADPVFGYSDGLMQYTNVLVGFSNAQCKNDLSMRPYMILEDAEGNEITLYGGTVTRSIGYIALQNKDTFAAGTEAYDYVRDIIHSVYGDIYDEVNVA